MRRNFAYLKYVLMHKYYVLVAGRLLKLGWWQLLLHDWSKFRPDEWKAYAYTFYDDNGDKIARPEKFYSFDRAVHLHRRRNMHHPQYWHRPAGSWPYPMPGKVLIEMIADWAATGKAKSGEWDLREWYKEAKLLMEFHPDTWIEVNAVVELLCRKLEEK